MKKMIFIGSVYPETVLQALPSIGSNIDFAAQTFQSALLEGLDVFYPNRTIIAASPIDSYPKVKKVLFKRKLFSHKNRNDEGNDVFVGMLNLPLIKMLSKCLRLFREIRRQTKAKDVEYIAVVYSCVSPALMAFWLNRRRFKRSCLIVPDLPEFVSSKKSILYSFAKHLEKWLTYPVYRSIDKYVLLSPYMQEKLPMQGKQFVVVEGIYRPTKGGNVPANREIKIDEAKRKAILYTGNLNRRYGIPFLLEVFSKLGDRYELWIRGDGETKEEILHLSKTDSRVKYIEPLDKARLLDLLEEADVLVNPVSPDEEFTRYFFPSKTMEYIASGTPVVMSHLACIPKEYDRYLIYPEENSVESFSRAIEYACSLKDTEKKERAFSARHFMENDKNSFVQAEKIHRLIGA